MGSTENIWSDLGSAGSIASDRRILSLFDEPGRFAHFSARLGDMVLDFSKTNIDRDALRLLLRLAEGADVAGKRARMFAGERINATENRAVLHTALRANPQQADPPGGPAIAEEVAGVLDRMEAFAAGIRTGEIAACDGQPFTDVINIGIGGSDLGPAMATLALAPYHDGPRLHYVSNIDGAHIADTLKPLDPARTLVVVASKTFTTVETMTNAATARAWLEAALADGAGRHLAAVSTALEKTAAFGIDPSRVFGFWDWVGGRYSIWGAVGLPLMIAIGPHRFREFLSGAADMDAHFRDAPLAENLPVLLGLVGIWHRDVCGYPSRAVLPYDQRLLRLPAYLQQLDMESNGKSVTMNGEPVERATGPIVWGEPGTNGQHAFFQLLHQGTEIVPCEFLVAARRHEPDLRNHHELLLANCLAQSEALMRGRNLAETLAEGARPETAPHRVFAGNRPSITLIYPLLDPATLGRIIALYEHRVFVEGAIWGINSFDQWGVELGKERATALLPSIQSGTAPADRDGSTTALAALVAEFRR